MQEQIEAKNAPALLLGRRSTWLLPSFQGKLWLEPVIKLPIQPSSSNRGQLVLLKVDPDSRWTHPAPFADLQTGNLARIDFLVESG